MARERERDALRRSAGAFPVAAAALALAGTALLSAPRQQPWHRPTRGCPGTTFVVPRLLTAQRWPEPGVALQAEGGGIQTQPRQPGSAFHDRSLSGETGSVPPAFESWTDYTRHALGVEDRFEDPEYEQASPGFRASLGDRRRSLGIDFGPQFTGLALSLGGTNTVPLGTLQTGEDWKETALKIVQIASTRRVRDVVVGMPLEKDGSEGKIARLVRHFTQILADATLLVSGPNTTIYLWDERFSTAYAAVRLITRPRFEGGAFKSWLDGQRGLAFGAKALLDAEAARTILEHWLEKDPRTEIINKERSERVAPSREACMSYLSWRKREVFLPRPKEPSGPGKEGWEWADLHPEEELMDPDEFMRRRETLDQYMEGMDRFGDREFELEKRKKEQRKEKDRERLIEDLQDDSPVRDAFRAATAGDGDDEKYQGLRAPKDSYMEPR